MRRLGILSAIAFSAFVSGCANGYQQFYQPIPQASNRIAKSTSAPSIRTSTGDATKDMDALYVEGFSPVGYASFNGPMANIRGALIQAKKVGATYVVASRQYTNTVSGALPIVTPTTNTSYSSGTVNAYGSGGFATGNYSGTTTSYGSQTTYVPYSIARFDQAAVFYAPMTRTGFGALIRPLTNEEARSIGTAKAGYLRAVRRGSPAFEADVLPGDILRSVNGTDLIDLAHYRDYFRTDGPNHIVVIRGGQIIEKDVIVPASW
jgi:hypothetical protein